MGNTGSAVRIVYGGMAEELSQVVDLLMMRPESNSVMWNVVQTIFHITLPVGLMAAVLFCLMSLLEKTLTLENLSVERIAKFLLFFVVGKACLENSFEIMGWLYQMVAEIIGDLGAISQTGIPEADFEALTAAIEGMSFWDKLLFEFKLTPVQFFMSIMRLIIKAIAIGRMMEVYIYVALAPLPLSTLVSSSHSGVAKRFLQGYLGACLQGLIMLVSIMLYHALEVQMGVTVDVDTMLSGSLDFMLVSVVLLMVLVKSGSWAKTVVGLI